MDYRITFYCVDDNWLIVNNDTPLPKSIRARIMIDQRTHYDLIEFDSNENKGSVSFQLHNDYTKETILKRLYQFNEFLRTNNYPEFNYSTNHLMKRKEEKIMERYNPIYVELYEGSYYVKAQSKFFIVFKDKKVVCKSDKTSNVVVDLGKYNSKQEVLNDYPRAFFKK